MTNGVAPSPFGLLEEPTTEDDGYYHCFYDMRYEYTTGVAVYNIAHMISTIPGIIPMREGHHSFMHNTYSIEYTGTKRLYSSSTGKSNRDEGRISNTDLPVFTYDPGMYYVAISTDIGCYIEQIVTPDLL